jgi:D-sedoheptulose 7-phosphate isomerase
LIVGINSDKSVRAIKGAERPINNEDSRRAVLLGLEVVDEVIVFENLRPDVLVKGGDWKLEEIVGGDFVRSYGGQVLSLPLKEGYSTTRIVDKIREHASTKEPLSDSTIVGSLNQHIEVFRAILDGNTGSIKECSDLILGVFRAGKKVLLCGNGGSAADAQHIAAEFVGRYETERRALPAIALTTDTSALTAVANDYDFERIFSRQVDALAVEGDCLIAISTSGNSPNVISAVMTARKLGCKVVGMTGSDGKKLASLSDACIMIPSDRTARIQEAHITVAHIWCETIDRWLADMKDQ